MFYVKEPSSIKWNCWLPTFSVYLKIFQFTFFIYNDFQDEDCTSINFSLLCMLGKALNKISHKSWSAPSWMSTFIWEDILMLSFFRSVEQTAIFSSLLRNLLFGKICCFLKQYRQRYSESQRLRYEWLISF